MELVLLRIVGYGGNASGGASGGGLQTHIPTNNIQHPADTHTTATAPLDDDAGILDTEVGSPVLCLVLYTKLSPNLQDVLQGKWVNM